MISDHAQNLIAGDGLGIDNNIMSITDEYAKQSVLKNDDFKNATDIVIGPKSEAGFRGIEIGSNVKSGSDLGVSIGHGSASLSSVSLAIGTNSQAGCAGTENRSISIGRGSIVEGHHSICVGSNTEIPVSVTSTTVIGCNFTSAVNSRALYIANVRIDPSPVHILYFNNVTREVTYGAVNAGGKLESDIAELTKKVNEEYSRLLYVENTVAKNLSSHSPRFAAIEARLSALEDSR